MSFEPREHGGGSRIQESQVRTWNFLNLERPADFIRPALGRSERRQHHPGPQRREARTTSQMLRTLRSLSSAFAIAFLPEAVLTATHPR